VSSDTLRAVRWQMLNRQAEMGMKMFAGMLEQSEKPKEPAR
jgi:hypothetical protein